MDTTWFAVDKEGHVATFFSAASGAVPTEVTKDYDALRTMEQQLEELLPRGEMLYDREGYYQRDAEPDGFMHSAESVSLPTLLFLKSLDLVAEEIAAGRALQLRCKSDFAVFFSRLPPGLFRQLHEQGVCLCCFCYGPGSQVDPAEPLAGLYKYCHFSEEHEFSAPYGRIRVPVSPLHVDQLPPALRNQLKVIRFDVNFAKTPLLQPIEHTECEFYEPAWLDVRGKENLKTEPRWRRRKR
jgi:hypothetical protein